jgi:hypothetical protein
MMGQASPGGFDPLEILKGMGPEQREAIHSRFGFGSSTSSWPDRRGDRGETAPLNARRLGGRCRSRQK